MENLSQSRATVSFHLSASEKERLVQAANDSFGSITDYIKFKLFYNEDKKDLAQAQSKIRQLEEKIDTFVTHPLLDALEFEELYSRVAGQWLSFKGVKGKKEAVKIDSKESLILLMTKCFKICS